LELPPTIFFWQDWLVGVSALRIIWDRQGRLADYTHAAMLLGSKATKMAAKREQSTQDIEEDVR